MWKRRHLAAFVLGSGTVAGCGGGGSGVLLAPSGLDAASGSDADFTSPDATADGAALLQVAIEEAGCEDRCASLVATANGGNPPYHYQWDDGSLAASRVACSAPEGGAWSVTVTDTPKGGEIPTPAQVVTATWPDSGAPLSCPLDAAAPADAPSDPLLDGRDNPDVPDGACSALRLRDDSGFCGSTSCTFSFCPAGPAFLDSVSYFEWTLPFPLHAGQSYTLSFVSMDAALNGSDQVEAWGSTGHCGLGEKFPGVGQVTSTNGTWRFDDCVTPSADYSAVTLEFDWGANSGATGDVYLEVCSAGVCTNGLE